MFTLEIKQEVENLLRDEKLQDAADALSRYLLLHTDPSQIKAHYLDPWFGKVMKPRFVKFIAEEWDRSVIHRILEKAKSNG